MLPRLLFVITNQIKHSSSQFSADVSSSAQLQMQKYYRSYRSCLALRRPKKMISNNYRCRSAVSDVAVKLPTDVALTFSVDLSLACFSPHDLLSFDEPCLQADKSILGKVMHNLDQFYTVCSTCVNNLPKVDTDKRNGRESNPQPLCRKSNAQTSLYTTKLH